MVSGRLKQNTIKATVISDEYGATLFAGGCRPGRMHDTTAARVEGIDDGRKTTDTPAESFHARAGRRMACDQFLDVHAGHNAEPLRLRAVTETVVGPFTGAS